MIALVLRFFPSGPPPLVLRHYEVSGKSLHVIIKKRVGGEPPPRGHLAILLFANALYEPADAVTVIVKAAVVDCNVLSDGKPTVTV